MIVPFYAVGLIINREKLDFVPLLLCSLMMCAHNRVHYGPIVVFDCLLITQSHYHRYADVSESIELLNTCQVYSVESVSKLPILAIIFHAIYGAVCIQLTQFFLVMIVRIHVPQLIIITKSEIWTICQCLGLCNEPVICTVCFYVLLKRIYHNCKV